MISLSNLAMRFGAQELFSGVNWRLGPGVHYGLVGANGSGKSTLLKLMSGELKPESGQVSRPNDMRLGILPQDSAKHDEQALIDVVIQGRPRLWAALDEKARLEAAHTAHDAALDDTQREEEGHRLAELESVIAHEDGYTAEPRAGALLEGLGIPSERHRRPMSELSGGYRLRVLLAQTLFQEAELLLLDEPTNHLDIVSIRWLEGYLRDYPGTIVLVSHDRHFMNAVCTEIADVDYGELTLYTGNYDQFEAAKALAEKQRGTETERLEKKIAESQQFIDRFKAKATKARQAGSRAKQIERLERDMPVIKTSSRRFPKFRFGMVRPSGQEVIAASDLNKGYGGPPVLRNVSFEVRRGEKLAVVGPNGIGKSTLLKLIAGQLEPDSGSIRLGYEAHLGYFGQEDRILGKAKATLVQWLHNESPKDDISTIRGTLGRVLFSGDDADKATRSLSGGETARLLLAALMLKRDNLLVLDEPTNHLDLEGREALLRALREYEGTLVFVSHDRHFVSSLARRVLALTPEGYEDFHGTYEEYLAKEGADYLSAAGAAPTRLAGGGQDGPGKPQDFQSRKAAKREAAKISKQVSRLEQDIQQLESRIAASEARFAEPGFYENTAWDEVARAESERAAWRAELNRKMEQWSELSAQLERQGEAS